MGAFLADAATVGLHGLQDPEEVVALLAERDEEGMPEFFHPPANPQYQVARGEQSAYAYEVLPLLHTLMATGRFRPGRFADDALQFFSGTRGPVNAGPRAWLARWLGADAPPIDQGLDRASAGVPGDERANALVKVPLLVARYAATGQLAAAVEAAVRVQQASDAAVAAALAFAAVLERMIVVGDSVQAAVEWAARADALPPAGRAAAADALAAHAAVDHTEAVAGWGRGDGASEALRGGLHAALAAGGSFRAGVRAGICAGGDSCSRAHVTGALLAAAAGEDALPKAWRRKAVKYLDIKQMRLDKNTS
ncbi:hypothetical protein WJX81_001682 [Elliptochloris bilobata]|uniref:ADP-ribosylglycohydrolase n=1 Tax=Elliptochloris bilobata TaxID=381761 RepID=A0AAW1SCH2_9CHLO